MLIVMSALMRTRGLRSDDEEDARASHPAEAAGRSRGPIRDS